MQGGETGAEAVERVGLRGWLKRNRRLLRVWLVFLGLLAAFQLFLDGMDPRAWQWLNEGTARLTAWALHLLGHAGRADGVLVLSDLYSVEIIRECTAVHPAAIFIAAVLAHPARWGRKLAGIGLGLPVLLGINLVRLVSLCYVGAWRPDLFTTAHELVWQSLMIFFTVALWLSWAVTLGRS